jgi:hypothetical protein
MALMTAVPGFLTVRPNRGGDPMLDPLSEALRSVRLMGFWLFHRELPAAIKAPVEENPS